MIGIFLVLWSPLAAHAFRFTPMVSELKPSGPKATYTFTAENAGKERIALQIEAFTREIAPDGKENRKPTEDLNIYPDQISLDPGARRKR